MLNLASFITPLAVRPDPNGGVANALHGRALEYNKKQNEDQLAEQVRHSQTEEGIQQGHLDLSKLEHSDAMSEHERELHTTLTKWAMNVLDKEGLDKAREIAGPVLDAAGIGVDFGGAAPATTGAQAAPGNGATPAEAGAAQPEEDDGFAALEEAQKKRGGLDEYTPPAPPTGPKPGESMSSYAARLAASTKAEKPPTKEPAPTEETLDKEATEGPVEAEAVEEARAAEGKPQAWRLFNKRTGETYGTIDPEKVDALNQKRAYEGAVAYSKGTQPEGRPIVQEFTRGARNEEDLATRMGYAEQELNRQNKTANVMANHKGGPGGGLNPKLTGTLTDDQEQHVQRALVNAGVPKLNQAANDGDKVADLASSKDPLQDKVAAGQMLKSLFGAAASEGERAFVFGSEGEFVRLQQMANNWLNGGQMPPEFSAAIRAASRRMAELARKKARDTTARTVQNVENDPIIGFGRMGLKTPEERAARRKTLEDIGTAGEGSTANDEASKLGF